MSQLHIKVKLFPAGQFQHLPMPLGRCECWVRGRDGFSRQLLQLPCLYPCWHSLHIPALGSTWDWWGPEDREGSMGSIPSNSANISSTLAVCQSGGLRVFHYVRKLQVHHIASPHSSPPTRGLALTISGQGPIFPLDLQVAGIIDALAPTKARQK